LETIEITSDFCILFYQDIRRCFRNQSFKPNFHLLFTEDSKAIDLSYVDSKGVFYEDILKWYKKRLERIFINNFFEMEESKSENKIKLYTIEEENEENLNSSN
jgi:hypothetical protein